MGGTYGRVICTDGPRQNGIDPRLGRNGLVFVVKYAIGRTMASAYGVPPPRVTDIPGTEAWAVAMAAAGVGPGCILKVDC